MVRRAWRRHLLLLGGLLTWLLSAPTVHAHLGPPYPVLVEQPVGPYVVSALADPDVGVGTFLFQVNLASGAAAPADTLVGVWVWPESGHSEAVGYRAGREMTKNGERFMAKVRFDTEETWRVRVVVEGSAGQGETEFDVEVTPPTPGWLWTGLCLLPFVGLGALWVLGTLRSRRSSPKDA
jgi:hypothetical protein